MRCRLSTGRLPRRLLALCDGCTSGDLGVAVFLTELCPKRPLRERRSHFLRSCWPPSRALSTDSGRSSVLVPLMRDVSSVLFWYKYAGVDRLLFEVA